MSAEPLTDTDRIAYWRGSYERMAARNVAQHQALEQCQKALAMMIAPDAIRQTTTINAFEQCTAAELAARKALGKDRADAVRE